MPQRCRYETIGCSFSASNPSVMAEHYVRARVWHDALVANAAVERNLPRHKEYRHKKYLKDRRLRRAAKKAGMSPEQLRAERGTSTGKYKPGFACGRGLHKFTIIHPTYVECSKCHSTKKKPASSSQTAGKSKVKANKSHPSSKSQRSKVEHA